MIKMKKAKPFNRVFFTLPVSRVFLYPLLFFSGLLLFSCGQDPIFYEISLEEELVPPRISGTPTNIVVFDQKMYVAGETLHQYGQDGSGNPLWDRPDPQPPGKISALAATDTHLYALTGELSQARLYRQEKGSAGWTLITNNSDYPVLQNMYGDGQGLFVGAQKRTDGGYAILYERNGALTFLQDGTGLLKGAVWDGSSHLLATYGGGIFQVDGSMTFSPDALQGTAGINFEGLIDTGSAIAAVSRNGSVYSGNAAGFTEIIPGGPKFTGALALGKTGDGSALLFLGVQGGSGSGGYREILLSDAPWKIRTPGRDKPSSVSNYERYHSSIANHPVNHIFQVPKEIDPAMTIFASTQKDGLWSYRERDGSWQWNREP
jgi:hypothetical protein